MDVAFGSDAELYVNELSNLIISQILFGYKTNRCIN